MTAEGGQQFQAIVDRAREPAATAADAARVSTMSFRNENFSGGVADISLT
jgi:hypothetical protein